MRHHRLLPLVLLAALASPTTALGATPVVTVENGAGNVIASGAVVNSDPNAAFVTVTNGYHFWVAADLLPPVGGASLRPASIFEHVGGLYAAGGLIGPNGTAAWDGKFDTATGGSQAVRLHYELTSAGGAAALAANLLTIIADSLGASTSVATPASLMRALTLITDLPSFVDLGRAVQKQDLWGLVTSVEALLQSGTGRATLQEALSDVGVIATDKQLLDAGSVIGIMDWAWTLIDMMRSSLGDHSDGTVTFSVAAQATPTPTPTPTVSTQSIQRTAADGRWTVDFKEPVVSGISAEAGKAINDTIQAKVEGYIADVSQDPVLPGADPSSVTGTYQVAFVSNSLLSISFDVENYVTGEGNGIEYAGSLTFAVSSGGQIHLQDLFTDPLAGLAVLEKQSHDLLAQLFMGGDYFLVDPATLPMSVFDKAWVITRAGLELDFTQGDIEDMADGLPSIVIPWSSLASVLKPDGPAGSFIR